MKSLKKYIYQGQNQQRIGKNSTQLKYTGNINSIDMHLYVLQQHMKKLNQL